MYEFSKLGNFQNLFLMYLWIPSQFYYLITYTSTQEFNANMFFIHHLFYFKSNKSNCLVFSIFFLIVGKKLICEFLITHSCYN